MARPSRTGGKIKAAKARKAGSGKGRKPLTKYRTAPAATRVKRRSVSGPSKDLKEAREQQAATAEILKVIASSPSDVQPVFEVIVERAVRLCGARMGRVYRCDGNVIQMVAGYGLSVPGLGKVQQVFPRPATDDTIAGQVIQSRQAYFVTDIERDQSVPPLSRQMIEALGTRSQVTVPMLRAGGEPIGAITVGWADPGAYQDQQVNLLKTFADQAVIAIENVRLFNETQEAMQRQTATSDVLRVIGSSPGDLQPVFDAMLENATRICAAQCGILYRCSGDALRTVATHGAPRVFVEERQRNPIVSPNPDTTLGRALSTKQPVQIADIFAEIKDLDDRAAELPKLAGARTVLAVPMVKGNELLGAILIYRQEVRPFTDKQIELVENFAAQSVIAIENTRLLKELRESLQQQIATADVLKVISRSTVELETVLDTLVETVARLCRADQAYMWRSRDSVYQLLASWGLSEEGKAHFLAHPPKVDRGTVSGRVALERRSVHVPDVLKDLEYTYSDGQKAARFRTVLGVPLLREYKLLGVFSLNRNDADPFTDKEIELVTSFADQAVIAIENARLFGELRERQADLARSVDELTATGDVLKIISRATVDLETVLDTLVQTVTRLCRADQAYMFRRQDDAYQMVAERGLSVEAKEFILAHPPMADRGSMSGRVASERRAVHIPDVLGDPGYTYTEAQRIAGFRTGLGIPLLRGEALIGILTVSRTRVEPFTDKEIELATTFADQAVIAIENARLFEELRERQAELRVTFDNMGDGVVMFDAAARLTAWNRNFQEMLDLPDAFLAGRPSYATYFRYLADRGEYSADLEAELSRANEDPRQELRLERMRPDGRIMEVRRNPVSGGGFVLIYADITERKRAEEAIRIARDTAETALRELQIAQASLVHAQKMAALGQVTAGIAHEIKNPLNFVNNFAGLSVELLDELKDAQAAGALDPGKRAEIAETIGMLTGNLEKIVEHGRRADGIVRSMLQHSRGRSGEWQATDLNALIEEAVNLTYHGARAQDQSFEIKLERDLGRDLAPIDVVPQEMTRVLLNLIGNGFYAANKRSREGDGTFRPALKVTTRELGDSVEVRVRDNGIGVPPENLDKLFQPFFTTKPTGEGTGFGLSISYEIVTQQHGGTITVDSEVGNFTEFTVRLPRRRHAVSGRMG
jgi:PAS domain S-box-containing protein